MVIRSRMKWEGHVAHMAEMRSVYKILVRNPERTSPLGRAKRRGEDIIRIDIWKIGWDGVDWMHLAQYMEHRLNVANTKYSFGFRKRRRIS
jgi:hypothetical protein